MEWLPTRCDRYKRNVADEYSIAYFQTDVVAFAVTQPEILVVGCNMGKVNTYNAISPATISNGAYTAQSAAANPFCYALEFARSSAATLVGIDTSQLNSLGTLITMYDTMYNCTKFTNGGNTTAFSACPGLSLYGGPTGPVAPGAIQN